MILCVLNLQYLWKSTTPKHEARMGEVTRRKIVFHNLKHETYKGEEI